VLQILLVGARYQTHLVVASYCERLPSIKISWQFILFYMSLVMRQSIGWSCSANDKKSPNSATVDASVTDRA